MYQGKKEKGLKTIKSEMGKTRDSSGNTMYGEWWANRVGDNAFKA